MDDKPTGNVPELAGLTTSQGVDLGLMNNAEKAVLATEGRCRDYSMPQESKERILAEELFREAVREQLQDRKPNKKPTRSSLAWDFLNSSFGLWFLGSVTLAIITWGFQERQKQLQGTRDRQSRTRNIAMEVQYRIEKALADTNDATRHMDGELDSTVFEEYGGRNIRSLLIELKASASDKRREEIKDFEQHWPPADSDKLTEIRSRLENLTDTMKALESS